MKTLTLVFAFLLLFQNTNISQQISQADAKLVAINFYYERAGLINEIKYSEISTNEIFPVYHNDILVYYAVNIQPAGFVLVAGNRSIKPVLAYSFNSGHQPDNQHPPFKTWINQYKDQIAFALKNKAIPLQGVESEWERLLTANPSELDMITKEKSVEPMLLSTWNQGQFYNQLCPADPGGPAGCCYTGCVATAMGQLCYYFRWPDTGVGSYSYQHPDYGTISANFAETEYQWNDMSNSLNQPNIAVAELLFTLGVSVDMVYGPNGSGMYNHKAAYSLRTHFKFAPETEYLYRDSTNLDWDSTIVAHLDQGIPMYYAGWSVPNLYGHAFIVDGYQTEEFFHFNWGWGGSYDGYFYLDELTPGGSNFNLAQELIINAEPDTEAYSYPPFCSNPEVLASLTGTIEDGSGPQYDYQNNADCFWLISPQNTSDSVSYITLNFNQLQTEINQDIITIYDGMFESDPVLGIFSGDIIPGTITSTGNRVLIHFESNSSNTDLGWFLSYHSTQPTWCSGMQVLTEPTNSFSDGSGSFYYRNGSTCMWNIQPPDASEVTIHFTAFDTEEEKDVVKIYDAGTNQLLQTYSGAYASGAMPPSVTSYSGKMMVAFSSNPTNNEPGWEAFYESAFTGGKKYNLEYGNISCFPNPVNDELNIMFEGFENRKIELEFSDYTGKQLLHESFVVNDKSYVHKPKLDNFQKGLYILRIQSDLATFVKKIVIH
ncbi:MAG: C10 family peptidase [Bacteroidales bacterium]|nr:C10 family peptidase [Bacteroidales bacterium]